MVTPWLVTPLLILLTTTVSPCFGFSALNFDEEIHRVQQSGASCFLSLAEKNFDPFSTVAMVKTRTLYESTSKLAISTEDLILSKLVESVEWSVMTKMFVNETLKATRDFGFEKVHNYVIVFQSVADLERALLQLTLQNSWNPHARFLAYFAGWSPDFDVVLDSTVKILWKFWVVNVVILAPHKEKMMGHMLLTYYPFHGGECGRQEATYSIIGTCTESIMQLEVRDPFPQKVPRDMNKCLVKVGTIPSPPFVIGEGLSKIKSSSPSALAQYAGIEIALISTIADAVNFDMQVTSEEFLSPPIRDQLQNSSRGLLSQLERRRIDIALGTISPTINEHKRFDFSVQYLQDMFTWIVPANLMMPHWIGLLFVFQPTVYGITLLLLFCLWFFPTLIVKVCAPHFHRERKSYRDSVTFLFITVGMLLANEPSRFPKTRFLKAILLMWTLFSFYFISTYNAVLMAVITNTVYTSGVSASLLNLKHTLITVFLRLRQSKRSWTRDCQCWWAIKL